MSLSVNHPEADELAHRLADRMGQSLDEAVVTALRERLARRRTLGAPGAVANCWRSGEGAPRYPTSIYGAPMRFSDTTNTAFLGNCPAQQQSRNQNYRAARG